MSNFAWLTAARCFESCLESLIVRRSAILACCFLLLPGVVFAQAKDDTQGRLKALEDRITILEAEIVRLKAARPATEVAEAQAQPTTGALNVPGPAQGPSAPSTVQIPVGAPLTPSGPLPVYGGASAAAKALNPDISVIGDFLGSIGRNPTGPVPTLEFHEAEVGLQSIIDPYARADFFVSFGERGVNLEEGYLTFTSLPAGLVAKVGKMRSSFGKVNTLHNHVLPWIDRPLVTESLVGGEDGIDDVGFSLTRILPSPKGLFLEGTAQVFRGDSSDVFTSTLKRDVSLVGHFRGYRDLTDNTNVDLGFSYARGHNDLGSAFRTQLFGVDSTLRWKPLRRSIYHSFVNRTELVWSNREQVGSVARAFGLYTSADYQFGRRWFVGGRYDRSDRARESNLTDSGFSALLTYWPSEFSQIRGQYRFARYADGREGNELRFQFLFSMGAHGAHPF